MKRFISILLLSLMVVTCSFGQTMRVGGNEVKVDSVIKDGRTLVKLTDVSASLDCKVEFDVGTKTIIVSKENIADKVVRASVKFQIGSKEFEKTIVRLKGKGYEQPYISGNEMDITPQVINGSTYIPIKYVVEPFGYTATMNENKELILEKA